MGSADMKTPVRNINEDRKEVLDFLSTSKLFHLVRVEREMEVLTSDVDGLLQAGGGLKNCLLVLKKLNDSDRRFTGFDTLTMAVAQETKFWEESKKQVLQFIQSGKSKLGCFANAALIRPKDVDDIFEQGEAGDKTLEYIQALDASATASSIKTVAQLAIEIAKAVNQSKVKDQDGKRQVIDFLSSNECKLLADATYVAVCDEDFVVLYSNGRTPHAVLASLKKLNSQGKRCQSFTDIIAAVAEDTGTLVEQKNSDKMVSWSRKLI